MVLSGEPGARDHVHDAQVGGLRAGARAVLRDDGEQRLPRDGRAGQPDEAGGRADPVRDERGQRGVHVLDGARRGRAEPRGAVRGDDREPPAERGDAGGDAEDGREQRDEDGDGAGGRREPRGVRRERGGLERADVLGARVVHDQGVVVVDLHLQLPENLLDAGVRGGGR